MKLQVPYYSQHRHVTDKKWRERSCSVVCLYMVLEYMRKKNNITLEMPTIDQLIYEGFEMRGVGERGWTHDALIWLFHNHGVSAYKEEFKSIDENLLPKFLDLGINKIKENLKAGRPVIVSGIKKWKEDKKFHTLVLIGLEEEGGELKGFYYNDPDDEGQDRGDNLFVDIETFKNKWRKLAIFVY